jgi:translation initiation factor 1A
MPNKTGGKNYKKSKHGGDDDGALFIDKQDDQQYGRVVRVLGNGNMLVYCNDDKQRICHIRGAIRKRVWINLGDLVLVSLRDLGDADKGDILAKYEPKFFSKIKKQPGVNLVLFNNLEGKGSHEEEEEDGIEFDHGSSEVAAGGAGASGSSSGSKDESDDDVDIDDI